MLIIFLFLEKYKIYNKFRIPYIVNRLNSAPFKLSFWKDFNKLFFLVLFF